MSHPNDQTNPAAAIPVFIAGPSGATPFKTGQQTTTASLVQLPSVTFTRQVTLTAPSTNTQALAIGPAGTTLSTGYRLTPGASVMLPISNLNQLYLIGANTSDVLTWIGY